jgi:lipid A 3-O-deacylase
MRLNHSPFSLRCEMEEVISVCCIVRVALFALALLNIQTQAQLVETNGPPSPGQSGSIWEGAIGEGFRPDARSINLSAGATSGIPTFGSHQGHDLALTSFTYGHMLGHTSGVGHWYRGNWEFRCELFTGAQFAPSTEWLVGLTPHLRYNFATGTSLIPFADLGIGVTATSIGPPDLSGTFEFNLQPGIGAQWFLKNNLALSLETRYLHMSCAGINKPNLGLNGVTGMLGVTFFF